LFVLLATHEEYNGFDQESLQCAELAGPAVTEAIQSSPPAEVDISPGTSDVKNMFFVLYFLLLF